MYVRLGYIFILYWYKYVFILRFIYILLIYIPKTKNSPNMLLSRHITKSSLFKFYDTNIIQNYKGAYRYSWRIFLFLWYFREQSKWIIGKIIQTYLDKCNMKWTQTYRQIPTTELWHQYLIQLVVNDSQLLSIICMTLSYSYFSLSSIFDCLFMLVILFWSFQGSFLVFFLNPVLTF